MDFFLAFLPEGHDVVCEHLKYAIKQAASKPGLEAESSSAGFFREWSIEGSCTEQGRVRLERLREGSTISNIFASTAVRLDDPGFGLSDTRTAKVELREEANPQFDTENKNGELAYTFRLVVTQTFASGDLLAIPLLPKPKNSKTAS